MAETASHTLSTALELCCSVSRACWFFWDFPSGVITCSKEYYGLLGFDVSSRPSADAWRRACHCADRELFSSCLDKAAEGKEAGCEIRMSTPFKGERWFCFRCHPCERGATGIFMDISPWRAAEEIIRRDDKSMEQLVRKKSDDFRREILKSEQLKRLEEGRLLAETMANELRNPLAALRLAMFNLKKQVYTPFNVEQFEHIDMKLVESSRAIENMIAYLSTALPSSQPVEIAVAVIESIEESGRDYPKVPARITGNLETFHGVCVDGDAVQLRQMFRHILDNAFASLGRKGAIDVTGEAGENGVSVRITDNGCGIPQEHLAKVFNPLFTTKTKGAGLGLAISRQIAWLHGGSIDIRSGKGKGTSVTVFLPYAKHRE